MDEMTFGKYEGHTPKWIVQKDPDYVEWLLDQDWFEERFPDLYALFDELMEELLDKWE